MQKPNKFITFIIIVTLSVTIALLSNCSSVQHVTLAADGSGAVEINVDLNQLLILYARDIVGGFSSKEAAAEIKLFDTGKIKEKIASMPHVTLKSVSSVSVQKLYLAFSFDGIENIFPHSKDILIISEKDGKKTLSFTLTADNFSLLTDFLGLQENEIIDTFGPQKDVPFNRDEYFEMTEYLFDEYASKEEIDTVLRDSSIETDINVHGTITAVESSPSVVTSFKGSHGKIKIPLVDILTLSRPIVFKITWE